MPVIDDDIHLSAVGNPMRAQQDPIERCSHSEGLFLHVHSQLTAPRRTQVARYGRFHLI